MRSLSEIMLSVFSPHSSAASHLLDPRNRLPTPLFQGRTHSLKRIVVMIARKDAHQFLKLEVGAGSLNKSAIPPSEGHVPP